MIPVALIVWSLRISVALVAYCISIDTCTPDKEESTMAKLQPKKKVTHNVTRNVTRSKDADAVREVIMLEGVLKLDLCARCGGRPGPEHRPTHDRWQAEVQVLDAAWALPAKEGR